MGMATMQARMGNGRFRSSLSPVNMKEIQLMESFYQNMCFLVSNLRLPDPLSLLLVQEVRFKYEKRFYMQSAILLEMLSRESSLFHNFQDNSMRERHAGDIGR